MNKMTLNMKEWLLKNNSTFNSSVLQDILENNSYNYDMCNNQINKGKVSDNDLLLLKCSNYDIHKLNIDNVVFNSDLRKRSLEESIKEENTDFLFRNDMDLEDKILAVLSNIELVNINGILMYLANEYQLPLFYLLASYSRVKGVIDNKMISNIEEFTRLNKSTLGYIGLINPLKPNKFSKETLKIWREMSTAFALAFLK